MIRNKRCKLTRIGGHMRHCTSVRKPSLLWVIIERSGCKSMNHIIWLIDLIKPMPILKSHVSWFVKYLASDYFFCLKVICHEHALGRCDENHHGFAEMSDSPVDCSLDLENHQFLYLSCLSHSWNVNCQSALQQTPYYD